MARLGGTFAPAIDDEKLKAYGELIGSLDAKSVVRDAMSQLHKCVLKWWKLPESSAAGSPHPAGVGTIVELDDKVAADLWDLIPWSHELESFAIIFDGIDHIRDKALRDAAFHLLWFVRELDLGREPITADKI